MADTLDEKAEREIKRVLNNQVATGELSKEQLKTLTDFYNYYRNKPSRHGTIKVRTQALILKQIRKIGLFVKKPYENVTKDDLKKYMNSLEGTNNSIKLNLAIFFKWLKKKDILYDDEDKLIIEMQQVKTESTRTPQSLITKDEVQKMIKVCKDSRTKAIISVLYESGLRASELVSLNIKDVEFDDIGAKVWVRESKTKKRYVRVVDSVPILSEYIQSRDADPDAPLFVSYCRTYGAIHNDIRLQGSGITKIIKTVAKRAGIKKNVFSHLLRHSAVTNLHKEGMDTILSAKRHGITRKTLEDVYLHSSDEDEEKAFLKAKGITKSDEELVKEQEEKEKLAPKKCANCGTINSFDKKYCDNCKKPIDLKTFVEADENKENEIKNIISKLLGVDIKDLKKAKELMKN